MQILEKNVEILGESVKVVPGALVTEGLARKGVTVNLAAPLKEQYWAFRVIPDEQVKDEMDVHKVPTYSLSDILVRPPTSFPKRLSDAGVAVSRQSACVRRCSGMSCLVLPSMCEPVEDCRNPVEKYGRSGGRALCLGSRWGAGKVHAWQVQFTRSSCICNTRCEFN